jgi:rhodanese-related sulfurtransferase
MLGIKEIDSERLASWLEEDAASLRLVDVRSMSEIAQGVLAGAEAMPMHLIPLRFGELDKNTRIVFYCRTGARSAQVCAFLQQQGFDQVINLAGGIVDWHRRGYPIELPSPEMTHSA